ncbi:toxin-antitoxin system YwqK family antitoxin [Algisphaera agarilytica]|uniref:MORN repeat variant n=1 Tax=Algisphaera agarilytica TaxID=1385975 RepID=A0A7X0H8J9_9BACT|nr:hypothetical protein [Algisphaera agarilytica]MBB6431277.1 hypothetical protein [Algisphaera agarilytica]
MKCVHLLALAAICLGVASGDAEEAKRSDIGTAAQPIRCDQPDGEHWYLSRLRLPDGTELDWWRLGSGGDNDYDDHITDIYKTDHGQTLLMDMYHPRYVEILAPEGLRLLTEWSDSYEYVNGIIHDYPEGHLTDGELELIDEHGWKTQVKVVKGIIDGEMREYHANGQLMRVCVYENNRRHGKELWFHDTGKPWAMYHYRDGELHGDYELCDEEGVVEDSGRYEDGQLVVEASN